MFHYLYLLTSSQYSIHIGILYTSYEFRIYEIRIYYMFITYENHAIFKTYESSMLLGWVIK